MNFFNYIGMSPENFEAYITNGRVMRNSHNLFPLDIENKEFSGILFAMLDGKDVKPIIWKMVKPMTMGKTPLVNGFAY